MSGLLSYHVCERFTRVISIQHEEDNLKQNDSIRFDSGDTHKHVHGYRCEQHLYTNLAHIMRCECSRAHA